MSVYVYSANPSHGAKDLCHAINAIRLRNFDGMDFWRRGKRVKFTKDDTIICWGSQIPELDPVKLLNGGDRMNKFQELQTLAKAHVLVPCHQLWDHSKTPQGYFGRTFNHIGGKDLLTPIVRGADYVTEKVNFDKECRLHVFDGKSIRAGAKMPREGFKESLNHDDWQKRTERGEQVYHPFVRAYDGGWKISYDGYVSEPNCRKAARAAVEALGLTFGAVDLGITPHGDVYVLEVNRAPGSDPPTTEAYAKHIKKWMESGPEEKPKEEAPKPKLKKPVNLRNALVIDEAAPVPPEAFWRNVVVPAPAQRPAHNPNWQIRRPRDFAAVPRPVVENFQPLNYQQVLERLDAQRVEQERQARVEMDRVDNAFWRRPIGMDNDGL